MQQVIIGFAGIIVQASAPHRFPIAHLMGNRTPEQIAEDLGKSARTVQRWIESGINWEQADVFATKILRDHPLAVWGPAWHDAAESTSTAAKVEVDIGAAQLTLDDMFDFL